MIDDVINPWTQMVYSSIQRIDMPAPYDFFWVLDEKGRAGMKISFSELPLDFQPLEKAGGIIHVISRAEHKKDELFLLVTNRGDRDVFYSLCLDLISVAQSVPSETELCSSVDKRLRHWQRFLKQGAAKNIAEHLQMGLYAELSFLAEELLTVMPAAEALQTWVGPDFDKQDYSFESCLIEIKSFITSKGPFIKISSMHQLFFDVKPLFLIAYGISKISNGRSIEDMITEISKRLTNYDEQDLFERQLNKYDYFEGITEGPFFKYHIDSRRNYLVEATFPRIVPEHLADEIISVQYSVDLSKCSAFEVHKVPFQ